MVKFTGLDPNVAQALMTCNMFEKIVTCDIGFS